MTPREQKRAEWQARLRALQAASEDSTDAMLVNLNEPEDTFRLLFDKYQDDLIALSAALSAAVSEVPTELAEQYQRMMPQFSHGRGFLTYTVLEYRRRHQAKPDHPAV